MSYNPHDRLFVRERAREKDEIFGEILLSERAKEGKLFLYYRFEAQSARLRKTEQVDRQTDARERDIYNKIPT